VKLERNKTEKKKKKLDSTYADGLTVGIGTARAAVGIATFLFFIFLNKLF
jgi:hypothetical protein